MPISMPLAAAFFFPRAAEDTLAVPHAAAQAEENSLTTLLDMEEEAPEWGATFGEAGADMAFLADAFAEAEAWHAKVQAEARNEARWGHLGRG